MTSYGLTRGAATLLGAVAAAVLLWLAARAADDPLSEFETSVREYWTFVGLVAAAGFVVALSQLLGGWTKWGWPRISLGVVLLAFVPATIAGVWLLVFHQPGDYALEESVREWSDDLGILATVDDLGFVVPAVAFGLGLLLGLTFDTTGRRPVAAADVAQPAGSYAVGTAAPVRDPRAERRTEEAETRVAPPDSEADTRVVPVEGDDAATGRREP